jgi:hypothetical protein
LSHDVSYVTILTSNLGQGGGHALRKSTTNPQQIDDGTISCTDNQSKTNQMNGV